MAKFKREMLVGGRLVNLDTGSMKAIVTIPGWAKDWNAEHERGDEGNLATLVTQSVWGQRCIALKGNALAAIPWRIIRYVDGEDQQVEDSPLETLLNELDGNSNWADNLRATSADLDIAGAAFWLKAAAKSGTHVAGLRRLNPLTMKVVTNQEGILRFEQRLKKGGVPIPFEREEIIYFHLFNPLDDLGGLSPTLSAKLALETEINADQYLAAFFENYAMPPVFLSTEQEMDQSGWEQFRRRWERTFKGVKSQHKTAFLDRGMKPEILGYPLDKLALQDVRSEARLAICGAYGVPPTIAGATQSANYATAMVEWRALYMAEIQPRAEYLASVINAELVPYFDPELVFEFEYDKLDVLQEDLKSKAERMSILVTAGIIKPETAAQEMGYEESEVGEGPAPSTPFMSTPQDALEHSEDAMKADLRAMRRKALKRLKDGRSPAVSFKSPNIPSSLLSAIGGQLEAAKTPADVTAIFDAVETAPEVVETPRKEEDVQIHIHLPDSIKADFQAHYPEVKPEVTIQLEPRIEVQPAEVTVNVPAAEVSVTAQPGETIIMQPPADAQKAGSSRSPVRRHEVQKVKRNKAGDITGSETEVEYEFE